MEPSFEVTQDVSTPVGISGAVDASTPTGCSPRSCPLAPRTALFLLVLTVNLLLAPGGVGGDGGYSYLAAESLVLRGTLALEVPPAVLARDAAAPLTHNFGYHRNPRDGRLYSVYGICWTLAMVPAVALGYAAAPWFGAAGPLLPTLCVSMLNPVLTAAAAWLLAGLLLALGVPARRAVLLGAVYAFGTMAWNYAVMTSSDPLLVCWVLAAALALVTAVARARGGETAAVRWWCAAAGVALGAALLTKFYAGLLVPVVLGYGLLALHRAGRRWGESVVDLLPAAGAFLAAAAVFAWSNTVQYGGPAMLGYALRGEYIVAPWTGLWGQFVSPGVGLFWYAPLTLLAFWWLPRAVRRAPLESGLALGILALLLAVTSPLRFWDAGFTWGPRYLLPALPFLVMVVALGWPRDGRGAGRAVAAFGLVGCVAQIPAMVAPWRIWVDPILPMAGMPPDAVLWNPACSPMAGSWWVASAVAARGAGWALPAPTIAGHLLNLAPADHWTSWLVRVAGGSFTLHSGVSYALPLSLRMAAGLLLAGGVVAAGWLASLVWWRRPAAGSK